MVALTVKTMGGGITVIAFVNHALLH